MTQVNVHDVDLDFLRDDELDDAERATTGGTIDLMKVNDKTLRALEAAHENKLNKANIEKVKAQAPETTNSQAYISGLGRGVPFVGSFGDEIEGARRGVGQGVKDLWNGKGIGDAAQSGMDTYRTARDQRREFDEAARAQHPGAYYGGVATTGLTAGMAIPGGLVSAGALGATEGLGSSKADLTKGEVGGALADTAIGGVTGMAARGLLDKVPQGIAKAKELYPKVSDDMVRAAGAAGGAAIAGPAGAVVAQPIVMGAKKVIDNYGVPVAGKLMDSARDLAQRFGIDRAAQVINDSLGAKLGPLIIDALKKEQGSR